MGQLVDARTWIVDTLTVNSELIQGPAALALGFSSLTVAGTTTLTNATVTGILSFTTASAKIVPGSTRLSIQNSLNTQENFGVTEGGDVAIRSTLSVPAINLSAVVALTFTNAAASIIPGATSLSFRNNANGADNLLITDAGIATIRAGLTLTAGTFTLPLGTGTGIVSVGAADSGGAGFKLLRVPN